MKRKTIYSGITIVMLFAGATILLSGCANQVEKPTAANTTNESQSSPVAESSKDAKPVAAVEEEHGHIPGAHGGLIVPIGRDSYHTEAIFEKDGAISLYMLGADESKVSEVENQTLTAYVKPAGGSETTSIVFNPTPQEGDANGKTSRFTSTLPQSLWGAPVEVTIPIIRIGADRFRFGFSSAVEQHGGDAMPAKVTNKEEQELYLTPGGIYTLADIEANGNVTASQKFGGFMAAHDLDPKSGEKICPVTLTKANAKVAWIVGGKSYEFCCPPCVDEFVKMAKTDPDSVKAPEEYVKK